ncbi:D-alanine--D-alanine ligase [Chlamydiota bacterium]
MFGTIGVLMGGISRERDISIQSGMAIAAALRHRNIAVKEIICNGNLQEELRDSPIDIAFLALHGEYGEDGTVQLFLENNHITYTGSGVHASGLALNKHRAKTLFKKAGLKTPPWKLITKNTIGDPVPFSFPLVIKPVNEGSSIGLALIKDQGQYRAIGESLFHTQVGYIIEQYIPGKELTVGIIDNAALPIIEIVTKTSLYDFTAKYQKGMTEYLVPAPISSVKTTEIQSLALDAYHLLRCRDFSRIDIILHPDGTPYILEINTIPGFTETSLLPKAAQVQGISFDELCVKILTLAAKRHKKYRQEPQEKENQ